MAWDAVGPFYVATGDPTTALGADMTQWRKVRQVSLDLNTPLAWTSTDAQGGIPFADGTYTLAARPVAQIGVMDADTDQLNLLVLGGTLTGSGTGSAFGLPSAFAQIARANVPTAAFVPSGQASQQESAPNALWFVAGTPGGLTGMTFGRINEGEIDNPYTVTINAGYAAEDQDATSLTANYRIAWFGAPANTPDSLSWSLPTLS